MATSATWLSHMVRLSAGSVAPKRADSRAALLIELLLLSADPYVMMPIIRARSSGRTTANSMSAEPCSSARLELVTLVSLPLVTALSGYRQMGRQTY